MLFSNRLTRRYKAISTVALVIVALVIVVGAALAYVLLNSGSVRTISAATTLNVTRSATVLRVGNITYAVALAGIAPSNSAAYVYLDRLPSFMNSLLNVTLYPNVETKVNAGTASADIALQLTSMGSGAVTLLVTPISTSLAIAPDSQYISTVNTKLNSAQPKTTSIVVGSNTSVTVTTVQSTSSTTTVSSSTNTTKSMVLATLQKSLYYPLMLNYSTIYANTLNCNSTLYNATYKRIKGATPSGMNAFANVSSFVPYALYNSISSAGSGNYYVIYYTKTRDASFNGIAALTLEINASAEILQHTSLSGIFQGSNYTALLNGYRTAEVIGGACAAYVT